MDSRILTYIAFGAMLVFYLFVVKKQKAKQKETFDRLRNMKAGDHVITIGGLHGIIDEIKDENQTIVLNCEGIFLTFERRAISRVVESTPETDETVEIEGTQE